MKTRKLCYLFLSMAISSLAQAQDLLDILEKEGSDTPKYTTATFKFSRISFGHSVETRKNGTLDVFVATRFWNTPADRSQSFFAERLSSRIALEYGISDRLLIGFGGTTFDGRFDGFLKYKLLRQREDEQGAGFSMSLLQNASYFSEGLASNGFDATASNRTSFTTQLLIAKKFSRRLSLQLAPTFVHRGLVYQESDAQSHFALGVGGRFRLGSHVFLVSEYYYVANPIESVDTFGPFSIGVNWELSDVMLQFMVTNAVSMVEDAFITDTRNNFNFKAPNLNFGFHFTYTFHLKKAVKIPDQ